MTSALKNIKQEAEDFRKDRFKRKNKLSTLGTATYSLLICVFGLTYIYACKIHILLLYIFVILGKLFHRLDLPMFNFGVHQMIFVSSINIYVVF